MAKREKVNKYITDLQNKMDELSQESSKALNHFVDCENARRELLINEIRGLIKTYGKDDPHVKQIVLGIKYNFEKINEIETQREILNNNIQEFREFSQKEEAIFKNILKNLEVNER